MKFSTIAPVFTALLGFFLSGAVAASADPATHHRETQADLSLKGKVVQLQCENIDINALTPAEDAFVSDAVLFAFQKVTHEMDYNGFNIHLVAKSATNSTTSSSSSSSSSSGISIRGNGGRRTKVYQGGSGWLFIFSYNCRFCPPWGRRLSASGTDAQLVGDWQDEVTKILHTSSFPVFEVMGACTIDLTEAGSSTSP